MDRERDIGIALSGGGHRASLLALGVLVYLVDSHANERVATVCSVSGRSITNAFVAQECDFGTVRQDEFDHVATKFARIITGRSIVSLSSWAVRIYLLLVCPRSSGSVAPLHAFSGVPLQLSGVGSSGFVTVLGIPAPVTGGGRCAASGSRLLCEQAGPSLALGKAVQSNGRTRVVCNRPHFRRSLLFSVEMSGLSIARDTATLRPEL